ncbi:hypothetical protein E2C01_023029 [Portunus trituberculatus]|uniref:Uncharacterized protein n=1 Tax=Portunus trituberculatus TaxID=210409 RepID=A0A5B7E6X1_PORTR|nr:hypothetical protein [Portunus trituberculatus]
MTRSPGCRSASPTSSRESFDHSPWVEEIRFETLEMTLDSRSLYRMDLEGVKCSILSHDPYNKSCDVLKL